MAEPEYCTIEDVFEYAVPASELVRAALLVSAVDTAADTIEVSGLGARADAPLEFRAFDGGTIAAPLNATSVFYAKPVVDSDALYQVAAGPGGAAIDLTSAGENFGVVPSVRSIIHAQIRAASRWIDQRAPGHAVPFVTDADGNYPETVRRMAAIVAGYNALPLLGKRYAALEPLFIDVKDNARMMLAGIPLRDPKATPQTPFVRGATPAPSARCASKVVP